MVLFYLRNWFALFREALNRIKKSIIRNQSLCGLVV